MTSKDKNALIAAAVIFAVFAGGAFLLPNIMLALGSFSPALAGVVGAGFVLAFFLVFWLRARAQREK